MIMVYKTIPNKDIQSDAESAKTQIAQWFKDNPSRRVCRAEIWYGKNLSVKKATINEQIDAAAKEAMKLPKKL